MFLVLPPLSATELGLARVERRFCFRVAETRNERDEVAHFPGGVQTFSANQGNILCTRLREYARAPIER